MEEHHQNKLRNASRILLNCTNENIMVEAEERNRNPTWKFEWNNSGYLQPCAVLQGRTKLNMTFSDPNISQIIDHELLNRTRNQTYVDDILLSLKDNELSKSIVANLDEGMWISDACEMTLNLWYSHPVLDTFKFKGSRDFVYFRKLCVSHLLN